MEKGKIDKVFQIVPVERLQESPLNPRQHYDPKKIEELAESIKSVGVLQPLVVRSNGPGHEVIAGSRRYRAASLASLTEVPVIVRELTDAEALEIMVIENNQREDVNALEEAEGYKRLIEQKYNLEILAAKIGRSTKYIYDRLKLLQLTSQAKKLLLEDRINPGHAILLARLKPEEQKRALDPNNADVWKYENVLFPPGAESGEDLQKIVSVRELESWIDQHVRFDKKAPIDPMLFPKTAETVKAAIEEKEKVIQITYNYQTPPDAREGNTERIYSCQSWKIADPKKGVPGCPKTKLGVIVVGPERGEAFRVCTDKECLVHWGKEKRAKNASSPDSWQKQQEHERARYTAEQEARERKETEWKKARSKILEACAEKMKAMKPGTLWEIIAGQSDLNALKTARELVPKPQTAEGYLLLKSMTTLVQECDHWEAWRSFPPRAKRLGVDVGAILKAQAGAAENPDKVQTSAKTKKIRRTGE